MFCYACGKELPEGSRFCRYCGVSQDIDVTVPGSAEPDRAQAGTDGSTVKNSLTSLTTVTGTAQSGSYNSHEHLPRTGASDDPQSWKEVSGTYDVGTHGAWTEPAAGTVQTTTGKEKSLQGLKGQLDAAASLLTPERIRLLAIIQIAAFVINWNWNIYGIVTLAAASLLLACVYFKHYDDPFFFALPVSVFALRYLILDVRAIILQGNSPYGIFTLLARVLLYALVACTWLLTTKPFLFGRDSRRIHVLLCTALTVYYAVMLLERIWLLLTSNAQGYAVYAFRNVFFQIGNIVFMLVYIAIDMQHLKSGADHISSAGN